MKVEIERPSVRAKTRTAPGSTKEPAKPKARASETKAPAKRKTTGPPAAPEMPPGGYLEVPPCTADYLVTPASAPKNSTHRPKKTTAKPAAKKTTVAKRKEAPATAKKATATRKEAPKNGVQKPSKTKAAAAKIAAPRAPPPRAPAPRAYLSEKDMNHALMYGTSKKRSPGTKPPPSKMGKEDVLQSQAHVYMKRMYPHVVCAAEIGGIGIAACTTRAIRNGRLKGAPDYAIYARNDEFGALFVEFKIHPNKPTPEQIMVGKRLIQSGYAWEVIYDLPTFIKTVDNYMKIKKTQRR
jgi:hypothetical protein